LTPDSPQRTVSSVSRALVVRSATLAAVTALGLAGAGVRADGYPDCPTVFTALAGVATWYAADGTGACSYDASNDLMVTAVALPDWAGSAHCGQCLEVWGPSGHIVVRVVDQCPECPSGHLDLSYQAFDAIADPNTGVIPIAFRSIECPVAGNLALRQKEGSNVWWFAVQPRDTRYPTVSRPLPGRLRERDAGPSLDQREPLILVTPP
jgi:expansin (peptidoglycan-binding protein)